MHKRSRMMMMMMMLLLVLLLLVMSAEKHVGGVGHGRRRIGAGRGG